MTLPSNLSGTEIKRGEKYTHPLSRMRRSNRCTNAEGGPPNISIPHGDGYGRAGEQDGIRYNIYALGTSGEDSFVREINVCFNYLDRVVYEYDAISDLWTLLP